MNQAPSTNHQQTAESWHFTNRPNARKKPTYGIHIHHPNAGRVNRYGRPQFLVQFRLANGVQPSRNYRFFIPVGTTEERAKGARDALLQAVTDGLIKTPYHWDHLCDRIANKIRRLNERDGIRRIKPGPKPKAVA